MQLTHNFTVPADVDQAWEVLLDIERIAPCMPGAALDTVAEDEFTGSVKVRLGPIGLTYRGKAHWVERDADSHRAVIDAQGKDARGNGTAKATITATLTAAQGGSTEVTVVTDLTITGKPAQFGRGVMVDVGNKLIGQFADCLAGTLAEPQPDTGTAAGSAAAGSLPAGGADRPLDSDEQEVAATLRGAESASAEQLGIADQGTSDQQPAGSGPDAAERDEAGPDLAEPSPSRAEHGEPGPSLAEPGEPGPSLAAPGLADPDVVEAGEAGLRESTEATDAATAGSDPAGGAAVVAVPVPVPGEQPVEPAAASEAAPPAQRIDSAAPAWSAAAPVAHRPPPRRPAAEVEPIDLLSSAGPAVAKRLAAPVAALALVVAWLVIRRRR
ncbi:SRPBCC family protein [Jatrophihabitans sp.]|uniref:SRPBCC family protein n=1 Tax=Jatrophihabitans sp. TaxID=1932789 RepID=UPI002CDA4404|nr:SRPBCC family protein [Jatrophihabitans sp.]